MSNSKKGSSPLNEATTWNSLRSGPAAAGCSATRAMWTLQNWKCTAFLKSVYWVCSPRRSAVITVGKAAIGAGAGKIHSNSEKSWMPAELMYLTLLCGFVVKYKVVFTLSFGLTKWKRSNINKKYKMTKRYRRLVMLLVMWLIELYSWTAPSSLLTPQRHLHPTQSPNLVIVHKKWTLTRLQWLQHRLTQFRRKV